MKEAQTVERREAAAKPVLNLSTKTCKLNFCAQLNFSSGDLPYLAQLSAPESSLIGPARYIDRTDLASSLSIS